MESIRTENLIAVNEFCINHNIEISFINSLQNSGLVEFTISEKGLFIDSEHLQQLEKIVCFYYELDINIEGIEAINHLLERMNSLQDEVIRLKNRLRLYEQCP